MSWKPLFFAFDSNFDSNGRKKGKIENFVKIIKYIKTPFFRFRVMMITKDISKGGKYFENYFD